MRVELLQVFEARCADKGNASACVPRQVDCKPGDPDRCSGKFLHMCVNGRFLSVDCSGIGFTRCAEAPGVAADMGSTLARAVCVK